MLCRTPCWDELLLSFWNFVLAEDWIQFNSRQEHPCIRMSILENSICLSSFGFYFLQRGIFDNFIYVWTSFLIGYPRQEAPFLHFESFISKWNALNYVSFSLLWIFVLWNFPVHSVIKDPKSNLVRKPGRAIFPCNLHVNSHVDLHVNAHLQVNLRVNIHVNCVFTSKLRCKYMIS